LRLLELDQAAAEREKQFLTSEYSDARRIYMPALMKAEVKAAKKSLLHMTRRFETRKQLQI